MSFIVGTVLAIMLLDWPWRALVIGGLGAIEAFEILLFLKWRKVRARSGPEALIGQRGTAVTDCRPKGQVRVGGRLWTGHCDAGISAGDAVVVVDLDGIALRVDPVARSAPR